MKTIRLASSHDLPDLITLDIKTHYRAWTETMWRRAMMEDVILICCERLNPVGFLVLCTKSTSVIIRRCGARDGSRFSLIDEAVSRVIGHDSVEYIVPESEIEPGAAHDVSRPLSERGFKAVTPLLDGYFKIDGEPVAGVKFVRPLNVTQSRSVGANTNLHHQW